MSHDIFISYRRKGAKTEAVVLYYNLKAMGYRVFLDFTSLHSGKFSEEIRQAISGCTDFLLLINPTAFNRCEEETDCYRKEIEWALENNKNIIPILVNQKDFPTNIPDHLLKIKDFNFVPSLPLQFVDEMVSRLANHYLTAEPKENISVQPEIPESAHEQEEDEILKWASIREDQWQTCTICGNTDVEIKDEEGDFQTEAEEIGQCMHYLALLSICIFPLIAIVYGLCSFPRLYDWFMVFLQENLNFVHNIITSETLNPLHKSLIALLIPVSVTCISILTRNILRQYAQIIARRGDDEYYYKAKCCCGRCKSIVYTEIPSWNLAKIQAEKESNQKATNIMSFIAAVIIFLFSLWFSEVVRLALNPVISFIAWPLLILLGCAVYLICVTVKYQKLKNQ